MRLFISILLWLILLAICWPLAILLIVLYPIIWLLLLPFRVVGVTVKSILKLIEGLLTLPMRIAKR